MDGRSISKEMAMQIADRELGPSMRERKLLECLAAADRLVAVAKRWRTIARLACACRARSRSHAAYQCIACEETAHLDAALADFEAKRKGEEIER